MSAVIWSLQRAVALRARILTWAAPTTPLQVSPLIFLSPLARSHSPPSALIFIIIVHQICRYGEAPAAAASWRAHDGGRQAASWRAHDGGRQDMGVLYPSLTPLPLSVTCNATRHKEKAYGRVLKTRVSEVCRQTVLLGSPRVTDGSPPQGRRAAFVNYLYDDLTRNLFTPAPYLRSFSAD